MDVEKIIEPFYFTMSTPFPTRICIYLDLDFGLCLWIKVVSSERKLIITIWTQSLIIVTINMKQSWKLFCVHLCKYVADIFDK